LLVSTVSMSRLRNELVEENERTERVGDLGCRGDAFCRKDNEAKRGQGIDSRGEGVTYYCHSC
jgi:hypothetical protein